MNIKDFVKKRKIIYLAGPYSHYHKNVMEFRALKHVECSMKLLKQVGQVNFCPIAQEYLQAQNNQLPSEYDFWQPTDRLWISRLDAVWVIALPGWGQSKGVTDEVAYAKRLGKEVLFVYLNCFNHIVLDEGLSMEYGTLKKEK